MAGDKPRNNTDLETDLEKEFDDIFDSDLPFKPLTEGLGFHQDSQEERQFGTLKARSKELERDLSQRAAALAKKSGVQSAPERGDMGELAPFYGRNSSADMKPKIAAAEREEPLVENIGAQDLPAAGFPVRAAAFAVDLALIGCALGITLLAGLLVGGVSFMFVRESLSMEMAALGIVSIAGLFYLFYFSFFDKTAFSTPGKKMLGIKVISETSPRVRMSQSLARAALTALSLLTFGAAAALDFQSKLTDTKVVSR